MDGTMIDMDINANIVRGGPDECWPWAAGKTGGYGCVRHEGRSEYVHRLVYAEAHGPIPDGLVVDHTCHNADRECPGGSGCHHRSCQNPRHLALTTIGENRSRARIAGQAAKHAAKTECVNGHRLEPANLMNTKSGVRVCKSCAKTRRDAHRARAATRR